MNSSGWFRNADRQHRTSLLAGTMGWGLDAFDNLIFSFTIYSLAAEWSLNSATTGMIASGTLLSSALGGVLFGVFADKHGRTRALVYSVLMYAVFTGICGLATNVYYLLIAQAFGRTGARRRMGCRDDSYFRDMAEGAPGESIMYYAVGLRGWRNDCGADLRTHNRVIRLEIFVFYRCLAGGTCVLYSKACKRARHLEGKRMEATE